MITHQNSKCLYPLNQQLNLLVGIYPKKWTSMQQRINQFTVQYMGKGSRFPRTVSSLQSLLHAQHQSGSDSNAQGPGSSVSALTRGARRPPPLHSHPGGLFHFGSSGVQFPKLAPNPLLVLVLQFQHFCNSYTKQTGQLCTLDCWSHLFAITKKRYFCYVHSCVDCPQLRCNLFGLKKCDNVSERSFLLSPKPLVNISKTINFTKEPRFLTEK